MSRGCPGGERRNLIRSPLKSLMNEVRALHHLLLAPPLGHGLTPKPVAGCRIPPAPAVRVVCSSGGDVPPRGFGGRSNCAGLPRHLRPAPRRRLRGSPGPLAPHSLQAQAKGLAAGERDWGHEPEPSAEIDQCICLCPCSFLGQNPGAVVASCPRFSGAPGARSRPWHVLALPGKGAMPQ